MKYVADIDVGTGSARAGILTLEGKLIVTEKCDAKIYREGTHIVEQSSDNIRLGVCTSVKSALASTSVYESDNRRWFDATCSLVVLDGDAKPLTVSTSGDHALDTMVWLDHHHAVDQALRIN